MNGDSFITPLGIEHLYVIESEFKMRDTPAEHMQAELSVDMDDEEKPVFIEESNCYRIRKTVKVGYSLVDAENADVVPLHVSVAVLIEAVLPVESKSERAEEFMLGSCVSIAYSHARSCIMNMASMSPVKELIIPTVDPRALVRTEEDGEGE